MKHYGTFKKFPETCFECAKSLYFIVLICVCSCSFFLLCRLIYMFCMWKGDTLTYVQNNHRPYVYGGKKKDVMLIINFV